MNIVVYTDSTQHNELKSQLVALTLLHHLQTCCLSSTKITHKIRIHPNNNNNNNNNNNGDLPDDPYQVLGTFSDLRKFPQVNPVNNARRHDG